LKSVADCRKTVETKSEKNALIKTIKSDAE